MSAEQFAQLPEKILVREIRVRIREGGTRVREVTLVTMYSSGFLGIAL